MTTELPSSQAGGAGRDRPAPLPAFVRSPVALDARRHAQAGLLRGAGYFGFAVATAMVPITIDEFVPAVRHYPIVLSDDESPVPMAVLGAPGGINRFVELDGTWRRHCYVPAWVRSYPFLPILGERGDMALGIDDACNRFLPAGGDAQGVERLFDRDGSLSGCSRRALRMCELLKDGFDATRAWVEALLDDRQLVGRSGLAVRLGGDERRLHDFRLIDMSAYRRLPAARVVDWHRQGWELPTALQFASQHNWPSLRHAA